jgi:hypothetical protein
VKILRQSGQLASDESIPVSERLSRPIGTVKQKTLESIEQPTFQPTIAKKSREIVDSVTRTVSSGPSGQSSYHRFSEEYSPDAEGLPYEDQQNESELYEWSNSNAYFSSSHDEPFTLDPSAQSRSHERRSGEMGRSSATPGSGSGVARGPTSVYLRSQRWKEEREERMKKEKLLRDEQELNECSFRPKIKETPLSSGSWGEGHDSSGNGSGSNSSNWGVGAEGGKSIAERQAEWQRKRDQKIERERREKEMRDLAECSFTPSLGKIQDSSAAQVSKGSTQRSGFPLLPSSPFLVSLLLSSLHRSQHHHSSSSTLPSESSAAPPLPPPPPRSVPRIGPRTVRKSQSPLADQDPHSYGSPTTADASSSSLHSSHPQEYLSPFLPDQYSEDHDRDFYGHRSYRGFEEEEGAWEGEGEEYYGQVYPPGDGEEDGSYFLEGSSEFLPYSRHAQAMEDGARSDSYGANYSDHAEDYEEYGEGGQYLPSQYDEGEYEEEDEPDQYPLPRDGYYENRSYDDERSLGRREYEDEQQECEGGEEGRGQHGDWNEEYSEAYEIETIHSSNSSNLIGMYGSPPPPLPPSLSPQRNGNQIISPQHLDLL